MAKIPISKIPPVTRNKPAAGKKQGQHVRLPQRSDQVEGVESDIGSVSSDSRTASQDPIIANKI